MEPDQSLIPTGCETCPNRHKPSMSTADKGKWGAYFLGLVSALLLLAFSFERGADGFPQTKEEPPLAVWAILFPIAGGCLGVQISRESFGAGVDFAMQVITAMAAVKKNETTN